MHLAALSALLLLSCCDYASLVIDSDGEVYECEARDGSVTELCYLADSAAELADLTGSTSCGLTDRWWPALTNAFGRGCRYECPAPASGCNALYSCFCPEAP